jgi:phosphatidylglycerol---prolipoprotein diacylglyceryl transferase
VNYITWDVDHVIFHIWGPFGIRWYSLFFLCGFLLSLWLFNKMLVAEKKDPTFTESLLTYVLLGTIIGARIGHCLFYQPEYYLSHPLDIFYVWEGGLASHGGYIGVILAVYIFAKVKKMEFLWLMDRVAMLSVMSGGFIRLGNLFNSEIYGKVTNVPWAFIFKRIDNFPRHPTQLYESFGYFFIAALLYVFYLFKKRAPKNGQLLGAAAILGFSFRSFIEYFKENQVHFEDGLMLNMGQLLSIPYVLVGVFLLLGCADRQKSIK